MPITLDPGHVAKFVDETVEPEVFDYTVRHGNAWLHAGAALLRAGRALLRQTQLDFRDGMAKQHRGPHPMVVAYPAIMLAAFAVENALKGVIAESLPVPNPPSGELPQQLRCHDLTTLALRANAGPFDHAEQDAIDCGEDFTTALGRYPTPMRHGDYPMQGVVDVVPLVDAYERIFFRCVEEVVRLRRQARKPVSGRGVYEQMLSGVEDLPAGLSEAAIRLTMKADGMHLDHVPT